MRKDTITNWAAVDPFEKMENGYRGAGNRWLLQDQVPYGFLAIMDGGAVGYPAIGDS